MQYIYGLEQYKSSAETAITLGKFDGLHRGHQKLIREMVSCAENEHLTSVVFSFDMDPLWRRLGRKPANLMLSKERVARLNGQVDVLLECPFTEEICRMQAEDFIQQVLVEQFHAKEIVVGADYRFGHDKRGDIHLLQRQETVYGYHVHVITKETYQGREISSTYIRECLKKGDMETASFLLGTPYTLLGVISHGTQIGSSRLGIPTVNVFPASEKILPPYGVYAVTCKIRGQRYQGIGNVGVKPTIQGSREPSVEVHLFDVSGDFYGEQICVEFHTFERPEKKFDDLEELKAQMERDISFGKAYFR